jgi:hypothetical protein
MPGAPPQADTPLLVEQPGSADKTSLSDSVVSPSAIAATAAEMHIALRGKEFTIPPDDDHDDSEKGAVYIVEAVEVYSVDDEDSSSREVAVAVFYDKSKAMPKNKNRMEWCSADEVQSFVEKFDKLNADAAVSSVSTAVVASTLPPARKKSTSKPSSMSTGTRLSPRLLAKTTAQVNAARCSGSTVTPAPPIGDGDDDDDDDDDNDGDDVRVSSASSGAGKRPKKAKLKGGCGQIPVVFTKIVSRTQAPGGQSRYLCEYKTNTGTVLLAHTKAQLSKEAIAAYEERKRNDTFRYSSSEALERKLMCGNNDKEQQKVEKQRGHSAGIGAGITCCGIEVDVYELFGKESCSQVTQSQNDSISAPVN